MGKRDRFLAAGVALVVLCVASGCGDSSDPAGPDETFVESFAVDPTATYFHLCSNPADAFYDDGAVDAVPILLADHGLAPGDRIRIEAVGDYFNGANDRSKGIAVFSSSATLLAASEPHRLPDAIEAGEDHVSGPTWGCGGEPMDIPEDFGFEPDVTVVIPQGATHLFYTVRDSYYEDNTDENGDFGVNIWLLEKPS